MEVNRNIRTLLERRRDTSPAKTFLFSEADGRSWTFAEFDAVVSRTANLLISKGLNKGEVVSLLGAIPIVDLELIEALLELPQLLLTSANRLCRQRIYQE